MKRFPLLTILVFVISSLSIAQKNEMNLTVTIQNELSANTQYLNSINFVGLQSNSDIVKALPRLTNLRIAKVKIYPEGITSVWDSSFRNSFSIVIGNDSNGIERVIIDKNNNLNFQDDGVFAVDTIKMKKEKLLKDVSKASVEYDWFKDGKKEKQNINVHLMYNSQNKLYFYVLAQHATAELSNMKLEIIPNHDLSYSNISIFVHDGNSTIYETSPNKYLKDGNDVYLIKDIDINKRNLTLEKENRQFSEIESSQVGFYAPKFTTNDIITKEIVSLDKYRGKYVFIDMWTTWCGACIKEMPKIKELFTQIDSSKIEFIGIVGEDKPELIDKIIKKIGITWKLIEANSDNNIFGKYKVRAFPTTLLIDPNGIIIKSNFRAEELKTFIENDFKDITEK